MWVVKRATSLFNSFCSNVAKKVALFVARFTVAEETLTTTHLHKQSTVNFPVTSLSETFKLRTGHKMQTNRFAVSEEIYPLYLWIFKCHLKRNKTSTQKMSDPCSRKGNLNSGSLNLLSLAKAQTRMTLLQNASHPILTSAYGLN